MPRAVCAQVGVSLWVLVAGAGVAGAQSPEPVPGPLAQLSPLAGQSWVADGDGFTSTLTYRWLFAGRALEVTNELRNDEGRVVARYHGAYVWDPSVGEAAFWTVAERGELHTGRAWFREGVLWHEARVTGGEIEGYASAMRVRDGRLEYFADYGGTTAGSALLSTQPLVYERAGVPGAGAVSGPPTLAGLAFMTGCWRGDFGNGEAIEEVYSSPSDNIMLGLSRFFRGTRVVQHEFSRLTADSAGVTLWPFPDGRPSEHGFRLTTLEPGRAVFEAPEHDFPKRILYWRNEDGSNTARIDAGVGRPRAQEWRMRPVACGSHWGGTP